MPARQDLEFTLVQGPGVDAYEEGASVVVEDLRPTDGRWPLFSPAALELELLVSALPMKIGGIRLGVLYLYGDEPGSIGAEHLESARDGDRAHHPDRDWPAISGQFRGDRIQSRGVRLSGGRASGHRDDLGSARVQCRGSLVRLRGHASVADRPIDEIAELVVDGSVRFHE